MQSSKLVTFVGGDTGQWQVTHLHTQVGESILVPSRRMALFEGPVNEKDVSPSPSWRLSGVTSNTRYIHEKEKVDLVARQPQLNRPESTCACLIPIRKTAAWWDMTPDQRRLLFEETSGHIRIGMQHLPAIARKLIHCRDLGWDEPFDFLTWFEFAPADLDSFKELLIALRATPEWEYIDREIEVHLIRA